MTNVFSEVFDRLERELWVITARDAERRSGLVASYVSKVSLVPSLPRITIAVAKHHFTHELIERSGAFGMHLLDEGTVDWVWRFGIGSGRDQDKFGGLETATGMSGAPVLSGALAWLDCRVEARMDSGDRTIYLAEVLEARSERTGKPLTFRRMLELAPSDKLAAMREALERDIERDRAAILEWRRRIAADQSA